MEHLCALMLLDGTVSFRSSHDRKRMRDSGVLALRRRIELQADEALTRVMDAPAPRATDKPRA